MNDRVRRPTLTLQWKSLRWLALGLDVGPARTRPDYNKTHGHTVGMNRTRHPPHSVIIGTNLKTTHDTSCDLSSSIVVYFIIIVAFFKAQSRKQKKIIVVVLLIVLREQIEPTTTTTKKKNKRTFIQLILESFMHVPVYYILVDGTEPIIVIVFFLLLCSSCSRAIFILYFHFSALSSCWTLLLYYLTRMNKWQRQLFIQDTVTHLIKYLPCVF